MVQKQYHAYSCKADMTFEQAAEGLLAFLAGLRENGLTPVKVHVATRKNTDKGPKRLQAEFTRILKRDFVGEVPALTVVTQPPADRSPLLAETWSVREQEKDCCRFLTAGNLPHVVIGKDGITELWTSGIVAGSPEEAFESLSRLLDGLHFSFDDIFRQWNYVGNILEEKSVNGKTIQNYQHFNDIRAIYYQRKHDRSQFPAATGIGMDNEGVCIDLVAIRIDEASGCRNLPMKSPVQKDAYRYQEKVLVGESDVLPVKNAPLFERGRRLKDSGHSVAMISGTASIQGEETVDLDDIERQTRNTLRFIEELTGNAPEETCRRARLYIKSGMDPEKAVAVFKAACPASCACTAVFADVCRDNLLVEIESDWTS